MRPPRVLLQGQLPDLRRRDQRVAPAPVTTTSAASSASGRLSTPVVGSEPDDGGGVLRGGVVGDTELRIVTVPVADSPSPVAVTVITHTAAPSGTTRSEARRVGRGR